MGQNCFTANRKYDYNEHYYFNSLKEWVKICWKQHSVMFPTKNIQKGDYNTDSYATMIGCVFKCLNTKKSVTVMLDKCFEEWKTNYLYWKNEKPWEKSIDFNKHDFKCENELKSSFSKFSELDVEYKRFFLSLLMIIHKELIKFEDRPITRECLNRIDNNMNEILHIMIDMLRSKKD